NISNLQELPLLPPSTGRSRYLLHPVRDLAFVEVFDGFEFHAPRRLAHRDRRHGWYGRERDAVHEHELDVFCERAATEAPAIADPIVRHSPLHGALEARERLGREGIDAFGDAALWLRQAGDVGEDRLVTGCGLRRAGFAGEHAVPKRRALSGL